MEFTIKSGSPEKQRSACVVVGVFDNRKLSFSAELIDRASNGYISEIIRRGDMEGKLGATLLLHNVRGTLADRVLDKLVAQGVTRAIVNVHYFADLMVAHLQSAHGYRDHHLGRACPAARNRRRRGEGAECERFCLRHAGSN